MRVAIAFKYCSKGCGADFYYGYSVEQTVGAIDVSDNVSTLPIILFDNVAELKEKAASFDRIFTIYLFRSVHASDLEVYMHQRFLWKLQSWKRILDLLP